MLPSRRMKVFACKAPTDMRGSFDSLYKKTKETIGLDPKTGHMFLFVNKNRSRVKVLYYDGTGYVIIAKRLDRGRFSKFNPRCRNNKWPICQILLALPLPCPSSKKDKSPLLTKKFQNLCQKLSFR